MAKEVLDRPRITDEMHQLIEERVRTLVGIAVEARVNAVLNAQREKLSRVTPRNVFSGDDALFLAYLSGFAAGAQVAKVNDPNALEIFTRGRSFLDKLAPIAAPAAGGNAS
jgi:hypothetical protein